MCRRRSSNAYSGFLLSTIENCFSRIGPAQVNAIQAAPDALVGGLQLLLTVLFSKLWGEATYTYTR